MLCSFQEGQVKYIVASSGFLLSDFSAGDQSAPPLAKLTEEDGLQAMAAEDGLQAMAAAMLFHFPRLSAESAGPNGNWKVERNGRFNQCFHQVVQRVFSRSDSLQVQGVFLLPWNDNRDSN